MMKHMLVCICCVIAASSCGTPHVEQSPAAASMSEGYAEPWTYRGVSGTRLITEGWEIHTTIQYDHIVDGLPNFYESLLRHYTSVFGELPYPRTRLRVFLFADESQWQRQVSDMLGDEARQWEGLGRGGLTIDGTAVLYHLDSRGRSRATFRIAAHEGWHQYAESIFKKCLPTWLDEGIGTWMEGFRVRRGALVFEPASNWDRLTTLRRIVASDKLSTLSSLIEAQPSELLATGRGSLLGYYAQLWAFTSFLMEHDNGRYRPVVQQMLLDAISGELHEPPLRDGWLHLFTDDPMQMEQQYRAWVAEYVRPGSTWR